MNALSAFAFFVEKIVAGEEGIFWSERNLRGEENWLFGTGKRIPADFTCGPFPFFSLTSFLGDEHHFVHFPQCFSVQNPPIVARTCHGMSLRETKIILPPNLAACSNETEKSFCKKVEQVKAFARQGELWVLNLAQELRGALADDQALLSAFRYFLELKKTHAGGVWWTHEHKFCSFSPEVFLVQKGNMVSTFPIKGTGSRDYLLTSQKEISELWMITDLLRNDLGQIARRVLVERERVLTDCGHFFHAHAEIFAELPKSLLSWEQYRTLLPAGSISGAPKCRVVEKILALESFSRELYTGTFGLKTSPQDFISNILIRTLFAKKKQWSFPVGAGITYESDPEYEWQETLQKAEILRQCLGK